jgi:hypothetical protein
MEAVYVIALSQKYASKNARVRKAAYMRPLSVRRMFSFGGASVKNAANMRSKTDKLMYFVREIMIFLSLR